MFWIAYTVVVFFALCLFIRETSKMKTKTGMTFRAWLAEGFDTSLPILTFKAGNNFWWDARPGPKEIQPLTDPNRRQKVRLATIRETPKVWW